jgi:hypothetical protein
MKLLEQYDLTNLINRSAEMVFERVEHFLEGDEDFCHCDLCVLDLIAFTLNHVTPVYETSLLASLQPNKTEINKIMAEIDLALQAGVKRITENPHHDVSVTR